MNGIVDQAQAFASNYNLRVFPIRDKVKYPQRLRQRASADPQVIHSLFTDFEDIIGASANGFGVSFENSTVFVVDIDVDKVLDDGSVNPNAKADRKKATGFRNFGRVKQRYNLDTATLIVESPSGGLHLYYALPEGSLTTDEYLLSTVLTTDERYDKIDIIGPKGYIVGPGSLGDPSKTGSATYTIVKQAPIIEVPSDFASALARQKHSSPELNGVEVNFKELIDDAAVPDLIPMGERDAKIVELCARWAGLKLPFKNACILLKATLQSVESDGSNDYTFKKYLPKLEKAYEKFYRPKQEKLEWMVRHLVYVADGPHVIEVRAHNDFLLMKETEARGVFKNWRVSEPTKDGKEKWIDCFDAWMRHPNRVRVDRCGYRPNESQIFVDPFDGHTCFNQFTRPDHKSPEKIEIQPFLDLVKYLWPIEKEREIILDWCAHLVQHPEQKVQWMPVLISEHEGVGKNLFYNCLKAVLGERNCTNMNTSELSGEHSGFMENNILILINEVSHLSQPNLRAFIEDMKERITEQRFRFREKYQRARAATTYANFILFTNHQDALPIAKDSTRFMVSYHYRPMLQAEFYEAVVECYENRGNHIWTFLRDRDISKFEWKKRAHITEHHAELTEVTKRPIEVKIEGHIESKSGIFGSDLITPEMWQYYTEEVLGVKATDRLATFCKQIFRKFPAIRDSSGNMRQFDLPQIDEEKSDENGLFMGLKRQKVSKKVAPVLQKKRRVRVIRNKKLWLHDNPHSKIIRSEICKAFRNSKLIQTEIVDNVIHLPERE